MSNKRITDLTELTNPTTDDVLPIVDIATNTTQKVQVGNLPTTTAVTNALATKQDTLVSGTNIKTINGTSVLGSGNIVTPSTPPSGVAGAIQFTNGSAFASDAANLFWDDTNNRLGIGTNAPTTAVDVNGSIRAGVNLTVVGEIQNPTVGVVNINGELRVASPNVSIGLTSYPARLAVRGSGTTSGTTSLLVQNSDGIQALKVADDGLVTVASLNSIGYLGVATTLYITSNSNIKANGSGIIQLGDAPETGFNRLQFGGTTSSFPSLKRNGTAIDVRLADDSNYASLNTGATFIKGSGSTSATTSLLVQNSAGAELLRVRDDGITTISSVLSVISYISTGDYITTNGIVIGNGNSRFYYLNNANANLSINSTGIVASTSGYSSSTASAVLEANSTTQGFLPPRMTTTQKNAIATPASGLVVYDSTTNKLCCYNGSTWNDLF